MTSNTDKRQQQATAQRTSVQFACQRQRQRFTHSITTTTDSETDMTTQTMTSKLEATVAFFTALLTQRMTQYVKRIIQALQRKAEASAAKAETNESERVFTQCETIATQLLSDTVLCKFLHSVNADSSVAECVERFSNVKALQYVMRYASAAAHDSAASLNNYTAIALRALRQTNESMHYSTMLSAFSQECTQRDDAETRVTQATYSSTTAAAQTSMTINALLALNVLERSNESKNYMIKVRDDDNARAVYDALQATAARFTITR